MKKILLAFAVAFPLLATYATVHYRQDIEDWWLLRGYNPPARIVALADSTSMTDEGRRFFYVAKPELNDRDEFWKNCTTHADSNVLGCYTGLRIFIFDVDDERLAGVSEVTAAHEMLHVAYERLSSDERERVDKLTMQAFESLSDSDLQRRMDIYEEHQGAHTIGNELHSILGTEYRVLPDSLEKYYSRYFEDRAKIVAFTQDYNGAFDRIQNQIADYDQRLLTLSAQINKNQLLIDGHKRDLDQESQRLDRLRREGRIGEYNSGVGSYNNSVSRYNNLVTSTMDTIDEYNELVRQRNGIVLIQKELVDAIDSRHEVIE